MKKKISTTQYTLRWQVKFNIQACLYICVRESVRACVHMRACVCAIILCELQVCCKPPPPPKKKEKRISTTQDTLRWQVKFNIQACLYICACVCVCVCVRERERVCVCVCACVREQTWNWRAKLNTMASTFRTYKLTQTWCASQQNKHNKNW